MKLRRCAGTASAGPKNRLSWRRSMRCIERLRDGLAAAKPGNQHTAVNFYRCETHPALAALASMSRREACGLRQAFPPVGWALPTILATRRLTRALQCSA